MTTTTDGTIITLDGDSVTLRHTLAASKKIAAQFGNFVEAHMRISKFDPLAYAMVVAAGLGKEVKDVEESVFVAGMDTLRKDLAAYLEWLSNGGRAPAPVKTEAAPGNV